ncbi:hypothetical protein EPI10_001947 [Gossypium australe]|uniref:Uncharacterized protein n=1 Tax=Gossypium australe TaxID=47621 RepID=A0A5B6VD51_9ROSI|nr:hypothetical protein EPI10_001947 [Gossypium australe]
MTRSSMVFVGRGTTRQNFFMVAFKLFKEALLSNVANDENQSFDYSRAGTLLEEGYDRIDQDRSSSYHRFHVENFSRKLHINILLVEALEQILNYVKFMKDRLSKKKRFEEFEIATLQRSVVHFCKINFPQNIVILETPTVV